MKKILTTYGVEVIEVERKAEGMDAEGNPDYISATKIRKAIREDNLDSVRDFLPPCTLAYLQSGASKAVRAKLREWSARRDRGDGRLPACLTAARVR